MTDANEKSYTFSPIFPQTLWHMKMTGYMVHLITWPQVVHWEGEKKEENGSGHCQYIFSFPFNIDNLKEYLVLGY